MREPSASQLALAEACQHAFTSGISWPHEEPTRYSTMGKAVHLGAYGIVSGEVVYPAAYAGLVEDDADKVDACVARIAERISTISSPWFSGELRLGYHVDTGGVEVTVAGRAKRRGAWTVEIDLVYQDEMTGELVVVDYKTGRQSYTHEAQDNPQVALGAIAASKHFGASRVRVELWYVDENGVNVDSAHFDEFDLDEVAARLRRLRRKLTAGPTPPVPGPHCTEFYCKLRGICSATTSALASAAKLDHPMTVEIQSAEHAAWMLDRLAGAEAALDAIRKAINEYARNNPIPRGNGKVYAWREKSERDLSITTPEQVEALRSVLGDYVAIAVRRRDDYHATLGSVDKAVRAALATSGAKSMRTLTARALSALEEAGALTVRRWNAPGIVKLSQSEEQGDDAV